MSRTQGIYLPRIPHSHATEGNYQPVIAQSLSWLREQTADIHRNELLPPNPPHKAYLCSPRYDLPTHVYSDPAMFDEIFVKDISILTKLPTNKPSHPLTFQPYNSLHDCHLRTFLLSNRSYRQHLIRQGFITPDMRVVASPGEQRQRIRAHELLEQKELLHEKIRERFEDRRDRHRQNPQKLPKILQWTQKQAEKRENQRLFNLECVAAKIRIDEHEKEEERKNEEYSREEKLSEMFGKISMDAEIKRRDQEEEQNKLIEQAYQRRYAKKYRGKEIAYWKMESDRIYNRMVHQEFIKWQKQLQHPTVLHKLVEIGLSSSLSDELFISFGAEKSTDLIRQPPDYEMTPEELRLDHTLEIINYTADVSKISVDSDRFAYYELETVPFDDIPDLVEHFVHSPEQEMTPFRLPSSQLDVLPIDTQTPTFPEILKQYHDKSEIHTIPETPEIDLTAQLTDQSDSISEQLGGYPTQVLKLSTEVTRVSADMPEETRELDNEIPPGIPQAPSSDDFIEPQVLTEVDKIADRREIENNILDVANIAELTATDKFYKMMNDSFNDVDSTRTGLLLIDVILQVLAQPQFGLHLSEEELLFIGSQFGNNRFQSVHYASKIPSLPQLLMSVFTQRSQQQLLAYNYSFEEVWCQMYSADIGYIYFNKFTSEVTDIRPDSFRPSLRENLFEEIIVEMIYIADARRDGVIDYDEFLRFIEIQTTQGPLTPSQIEEAERLFQTLAVVTADNVYYVTFVNFVSLAHLIIKFIYQNRFPNQSNWIELPSGKVPSFWFNKLTGETSLIRPVELGDTSGQPNLARAALPSAGHQALPAISEEGSRPPSRITPSPISTPITHPLPDPLPPEEIITPSVPTHSVQAKTSTDDANSSIMATAAAVLQRIPANLPALSSKVITTLSDSTPPTPQHIVPAPTQQSAPDPITQYIEPDVPTTPTQQIIPAVPTTPIQQIILAVPTTPTQQIIPDVPITPTQQIIPAVPTTPTQQIIPDVPTTPTQQIIPDVPTTPTQQIIPAYPTTPTQRISPTQASGSIIPTPPPLAKRKTPSRERKSSRSSRRSIETTEKVKLDHTQSNKASLEDSSNTHQNEAENEKKLTLLAENPTPLQTSDLISNDEKRKLAASKILERALTEVN